MNIDYVGSNLSQPYFIPYNFLCDYHCTSSAAIHYNNLLLSELPAIFKKHNISLSEGDILAFANNNDGVGMDIFDFEKLMGSVDSDSEFDRKMALVAVDFYNFHKKLENFLLLFGRSGIDILVQKLIYDRYGYLYNKNDRTLCDNFIVYLNNMVEGCEYYFNVNPTTDDVFQNAKMTEFDFIEQELRWKFYDWKQAYNDKKLCFLSERFYNVYLILSQKYPEISMDNVICSEEEFLFEDKKNVIYINDVVGERKFDINKSTFYTILSFSESELKKIPSNLLGEDFDEFMCRYHYEQNKSFFSIMECDFGFLINFMEYEKKLLENAGYSNSLELLPEAFKPYFKFCIENSEYIKEYESIVAGGEDKVRAVINMVDNHGSEKINKNLIDFLHDGNYRQHYLISSDAVNNQKVFVKSDN